MPRKRQRPGNASAKQAGEKPKTMLDPEAMLANYRASQEMALRWAAELRPRGGRKIDRLLKEMIKMLAFEALRNAKEKAQARTQPKLVEILARIVKDLLSADKLKAELEARIRELRTRGARKGTGARAGSAGAKEGGLSSEAECKMREILQGIAG